MTGDVNMSPVMFWGSLGGLWVVVGMPWDHGGSVGASWDGPGRPLGCFWRYGAILGSDLRGQNVVISLVLDGFLRCYFFSFFLTYLEATLFSSKTKNHIVFRLIF